jgi:hypothetical protein
MKACAVQELKTQEAVEAYYSADDKLDDILDRYYADSIMFMQINKPELYELYITLNKQSVKRKMLRQIVKQKQSRLSNELAVNRISSIKQELRSIKNKAQQKNRVAYLKKTLARLEQWAKDLNYEERKGKTRYKAQE